MSIQRSNIQFHYLVPVSAFKERQATKRFIIDFLQKEGKTVGHINYIFCDDKYLLRINQQYLNHNTYTDIITFELNEKAAPVLSDVYISVERVRDNARSLSIPFKKELLRVIFHGALHLAGYKDKSPSEQVTMRERENFYLTKFLFHVK